MSEDQTKEEQDEVAKQDVQPDVALLQQKADEYLEGWKRAKADYLNFKKENYRAEFVYALHPDHWGKGIMNEVAEAVIDYGFKVLKLHSIEANINPENIASQKLLEKHKFVKEAYFKENFFWEGKFLDSAIYSLLAPKQ